MEIPLSANFGRLADSQKATTHDRGIDYNLWKGPVENQTLLKQQTTAADI